MRNRMIVAAVLFALAACGKKDAPQDTAPAGVKPQAAAAGLDLSAIDPAIAPGEDFYRRANGLWLARTTIPDNRSSFGGYSALMETRDAQIKALLEKAGLAAPGTIARALGDYYAAYLDVAAINAKGLAPLADDIASIRGLNSASALMGALGRRDLGFAGPFEIVVDLDVRRPDAYAVYLRQSGLGLPDRAYYVDEAFAATRARYKTYVADLLSLAGESDAQSRAESVYALETKIAEAHWESGKRRNRDLSYNPKSRDALIAFAPADWGAYFTAAGLPEAENIVLREDDAIAKVARLVASEPLAAWRDYLLFHLLHANTEVLPSQFGAARAAEFDKAIGAAHPDGERWRRALAATDRDFGALLSGLYGQSRASPAVTAAIESIVANLRLALDEGFAESRWMTDAAKTAAREKLKRLTVRIGGPEDAADAAIPPIVRTDAYGNLKRARTFAWNDAKRRLANAVDRNAWPASAQTADLFYDPRPNQIVAPAAMLQPPFFDPNADAAVQYGAIGALIAHELTHGFDDQGRRSDADGVLRDWWTSEDAAAFDKRADALAAQMARYEVAPGLRLDSGRMTDEAVADLAGLSLALRAYHHALNGRPSPLVDGLSGDQRFFLAWAQLWKRKVRDEQQRAEATSGPLPPAEFRVNGTVRNLDAWHAAFHVREQDPLYLPPSERVAIW